MTRTEHPDTQYARCMAQESPRPALHGSMETAVAIIGGGLAGLSAAISLIEHGYNDLVVLESRQAGWGASGRNAGHVSSGFALEPWYIEERLGRAAGRRLFALSCSATQLIRSRIDRYALPCAKTECGGLKAWWTPDLDEAKRQQAFMQEVLGSACELWSVERTRAALRTERYHHALYVPDAFSLQPLSYVRALARQIESRGGRVYEGSAVLSIERKDGRMLVRTSRGEVRARHVLCACGGYLGALLPEVSGAVVPLYSHLITTAPLGERLRDVIRVPHAVCDSRLDHDYYSSLPDGRLLFGGGVSLFQTAPRRVAQRLSRRLFAVYPQLKDVVHIDRAWSGLMEYSHHGMPLIGQTASGIWYSAAHGGHGLGTTALFGDLFARAIALGDDTYRLFSPFRLEWTGGLAGRAAAQLTYWYYQVCDLYKTWAGRRAVYR